MSILTKKEFCNIIKSIKNTEQCLDELNKIYWKYNRNISADTLYDYSDIIFVLKKMFNDEDWISYWIWDLDFGQKYTDGCITEKDGTNIILKTPEDLYEFLIKEMKIKEDDNNEN